MLYLKDVIKRVYDSPDAQTTERVGSMMRPPVWCPDSKPVDELLQEMQLKRVHLVIVVDEFGGTAGMATIEDILEEIVGEITDEYDEENTDITKLGDGRFRVSSRLPIDELGELFGLELDDEDVETVGGLMAKQLNKVPIAGSVVRVRRARAGGRADQRAAQPDRDRDRDRVGDHESDTPTDARSVEAATQITRRMAADDEESRASGARDRRARTRAEVRPGRQREAGRESRAEGVVNRPTEPTGPIETTGPIEPPGRWCPPTRRTSRSSPWPGLPGRGPAPRREPASATPTGGRTRRRTSTCRT